MKKITLSQGFWHFDMFNMQNFIMLSVISWAEYLSFNHMDPNLMNYLDLML